MLLPKFTYVPPVLNASKAVVLNSIFKDELKANYKSLRFYQSPAFLIVSGFAGFGILNILALILFHGDPRVLVVSSSMVVLSIFFTFMSLSLAPLFVLENLEEDTIPARNEAVKMWVESRYGVEVSIEDISNLIAEHRADKDGLIRVNGSLVRFQTVVGEGQLLIDSAGLELKVLVPVS